MTEKATVIGRGGQLGTELTLMLVALVWGTSYVVAKQVLETMSIASLLGWRFGLSCLVLAPLVGLRPRLTKYEIGVGLCLGSILALSIMIETYGIILTSASNAGVLISLTVIMAPLLERWVVPSTSLQGLFWPAFCSFLGCLLISLRADFKVGVGDLLIISAALTRAAHLVTSRYLNRQREIDVIGVTFVQFAVVGAVSIIVALFTVKQPKVGAGPDLQTCLRMSYLVLACTVFAFLAQIKAVKKIPAARVGLLLGTEPAFAAVIGAMGGSGVLGLRGWAGAVMIVAATQLAGRRQIKMTNRKQIASKSMPGCAGRAISFCILKSD